jgi:hypothetical protein
MFTDYVAYHLATRRPGNRAFENSVECLDQRLPAHEAAAICQVTSGNVASRIQVCGLRKLGSGPPPEQPENVGKSWENAVFSTTADKDLL